MTHPSDSTAIDQEFFLVELSEEQLGRLPSLYRGLLVATSFAANEVMCLTRVFILTLNSAGLCQDRATKSMATTSLGTINRLLSAKAIEFIRLVHEFGALNKGSEDALVPKIKTIAAALRPLTKSPVYRLAVDIRNKLTHHYSIADFERLSEVSGYQKSSIWLSDMEGNSLYFVGEELTNIGLFAEKHDPERIIGDWVDWTREASRLVAKVHSEIVIAVAERFIPEISMERQVVSIPANLFAHVDETPIPLFWHPFDGMVR